ncbi:MAG: sulfurtransferase [Gammaproteobacteria bacterium]|jgi:thiosulfate/3-mercaptopyruvate sulfurtransferase|nr:sulfurtransferase [Gammaproteobacteria bacterium]
MFERVEKSKEFLITVAALRERIASADETVVIDVRSPEEYTQGHIPGAVNAPEIFTHLPDGITTEQEKEDFNRFYEKLFSMCGVESSETVIFYEDKYTLLSPRGFVILKYLGYDEDNILVLEGGFEQWKRAGYAIEENVNRNSEKQFLARPLDHFFVDYHQMLEALDDESIVKLDVRDEDEWVGLSSSPYGRDFAPGKGRLPNATWIEWYDFISEDLLSRKNIEDLKLQMEKRSITVDDEIILYCFKGARVSNSYIALRKLGYEKIRIYFAGWNEWCRIPGAPSINEFFS